MLFIPNKYTKIYNQIIDNAKNLNRFKKDQNYYEIHHIIPSSLGGSNLKDNKILLTAREHYICHWLLTKMVAGKAKGKMIYAFSSMFNLTNSYTDKRINKSCLYELSKKMMAKQRSDDTKGITKPKNWVLKHCIGENNPMYGKKHSKETREKMSLNRGSLAGEKNPMYGRKHSPETIEKIKQKALLRGKGK